MEEANNLKTDINKLNTELLKLDLALKSQNIVSWQDENLKDEVSQLKAEIKQLKVNLEEKGREIKQLNVDLEEKDREIKQLKVDLEEKDREIKLLKSQVEYLSAKSRKFDILSTYRDTIDCFKVFISEKLSKVNQEMNDWTKIKNTLRVEKYKNPKVVTGQLEEILKSLDLTNEEFDKFLGLKHTSNITFHTSFSLETLPEIKSHLENTEFPDDWKPTKQALTKIMGPLEKWLLLQKEIEKAQQAPKHEKPVTKTYDEYLIEKSKNSINISLPEARKPNEGVDESRWKD